jgi:hypothetical protein
MSRFAGTISTRFLLLVDGVGVAVGLGLFDGVGTLVDGDEVTELGGAGSALKLPGWRNNIASSDTFAATRKARTAYGSTFLLRRIGFTITKILPARFCSSAIGEPSRRLPTASRD